MIRSLFLPEEGEQWCSADFSQQEPRILTHYASRSRYDGADTIADAYHEGDADFHQEVANLVDIDRKTAKTIGLGIMYGMGKGKLADQLGVTVDEASEILSKFNTYAPFVRQLADSVMRSANQKGYIKTILGRRCHFDMWEPLKYGTGRPLKHKEAVHEYNGESKEWIESIEEIFFDDEEYGEYQQKGYERVQQLKEREGIEIPAFIEFLEKLL